MSDEPSPAPHRRRPRYPGKNPRKFEHKYKELDPVRHGETIDKVLASGKTPAGMHVPILLPEILEILSPQPGERAVDCTLGHGGHASALLAAGVTLLGLDQDPLEIVRTEARLREKCAPEALIVRRTNFAGLRRVLEEIGWSEGADVLLADLGCSSMQFDNPSRGFSFKHEGPLDMRMNPQRGLSAADLLKKLTPAKLARLFIENADEPQAEALAEALAGRELTTTRQLSDAISAALSPRTADEDRELTVRRVFQALRIAVNDEFGALDTFLRHLPDCLRQGGRVAVLTFHSGEDRRVKHHFREGHRAGLYREISDEVIRPGAEERRANPRSSPAKLRWARR